MKNYIGTKQLQAKPMNLGDYNKYRGWDIPKNEDPLKEGYLVKYTDGYESWSPKEVFEESYRETSGLTFGLALEEIKKGKLVARAGWNGKGMFLFMRPADELSAEFIIDKVKSLPESLKKHYVGQFSHTAAEAEEGQGPADTMVKFSAYICMKAADGSIVNGWLASQTDMLSSDWHVL